jgi:FlaA1/EpsC-like NDP-sugar epimerase
MLRQFKNFNFYLMVASDAVLFVVAHSMAYLIRFEFDPGATEIENLLIVLPWIVLLKIFVFFVFGLYRGMWRYTSTRDFWYLFQACFVSTLLAMAVVILFLYRDQGFSRAVFLLDGGATFLLAGGLRMAIRMHYKVSNKHSMAGQMNSPQSGHPKRVLIIGAGGAGEKILREIFDNYQIHYDVIGFIDDDPQKQERSIHGVKVLGTVKKLPLVVENKKIEEILIAIPSTDGEHMRQIVDICKSCGVFYKTLPGIGEIIDGRVSVKVLRDVRYEDLLGRPSVNLDIEGIRNYLHGRVVLITGCGGSIGSELCRQVIKFLPRSLILVDASEENLFHIQMELHHDLNYREYRAILGHVQDRDLMKALFEEFNPQVVFHAAAYKHVPILEKNPWEAIKSNIMGSQVLMTLAAEHNVERFVLVSTDKAVRPTNVMGASKRITELLLQSFQSSVSSHIDNRGFSTPVCGTRFMAVRFGNVVGSSGSVIPLFRRQIERGGPVTVTHPDVNRYFMTIPEAAQMIIQAGVLGDGGEIFILKMGTPVKIIEMARDLIRLSGKEPDKDIKIIFTGLREGEKLYEELITVGEGIVPTRHDKIMVLRPDGVSNGSNSHVCGWLTHELLSLYEAAERHDEKAIKRKLKELVPEYTPEETESILKK